MNRWFFWVLAPIMLATAIGMPFIAAPPSWQGEVVMYIFCGTLLAATLGLAAPRRFTWALKCVAAAVLLAYAAYAVDQAVEWWHGEPFGFGTARGQTNLFNALKGLVVFGVPSVYFLLRGRTRTDVDAILDIDEGPLTMKVRVINREGQLVGPVETAPVEKTDAEWRAQLTPEQFRIARGKGTERPFCGTLLDNKRDGVYSCICCGLPLFASKGKFNSGTGWPSFFEPVAGENVTTHEDRSFGMARVEILCARCGAHLGHVFEDGPPPSGLRYCVNSESLAFTDAQNLASLADPAAD